MISFLKKIELFFEGNKVETAIGKFLRENKKTVATTESCTGGLLAAALTGVSGASGWFMGGVVSYALSVKESLLGERKVCIGKVHDEL